jgi:para-nitrobenzyl esterase
VVDGKFLPRDPFDPDAPAISANVPVMVGYNKDETSLFATDDALFELSWESLQERLKKQLKQIDTPELIAHMRQFRPDATPSQLYWAITTGQMMGNGSIRIAERKSLLGAAPAYLYVVDWETPVQGGKYGSPHAVEIPLVFDNVADSESMLGSELAAPQRVADQMSETWLAFARTGDPNNASIPHWAPYDVARRATLVFDLESRAVDDYRSAERELLTRLFPITR